MTIEAGYRPADEDLQRLRECALFANLDRERLASVETEVVWRALAAGELLMRQGDQANDAWVVIRGRLEVVQVGDDGRERVISWVEPSETVGELALLTDGPRSASVRATRHSLVAGLSSARFAQLTSTDPRASLAITQVLATRLLRRSATELPKPRHTVLAVLAASSRAPLPELTRALVAALGQTRRVISLGPHDAERFPDELALCRWLDQAEREHEWIVLEGAREHDGWNGHILDSADRILLVAGSLDAPFSTRLDERLLGSAPVAALRRRELAIVYTDHGSRPSATSTWLDAVPVDLHHHVRLGRAEDIERLARLLTGEAIALILSGGAARGAAHVGVLRALEERHIPIDLVGGTSIGSMVAGLVGMGLSAAQVGDTLRNEVFRRWLFDLHIPGVSVFAGKRLEASIARMVGELRIEDLWLPMFCASCSLTRAEVVIHRRGLLREAIRSSGAIPGIVPPIRRDEELLADGMMLANLPVEEVEQLAPCRTIAVNLVPNRDETFTAPQPLPRSGLGALARRLNPIASASSPLALEIGMRSFVLGAARQARRLAEQVDCFIEPPVGRIGYFDLLAYPRVVEMGYEAASSALERWRPSGGHPGDR